MLLEVWSVRINFGGSPQTGHDIRDTRVLLPRRAVICTCSHRYYVRNFVLLEYRSWDGMENVSDVQFCFYLAQLGIVLGSVTIFKMYPNLVHVV